MARNFKELEAKMSPERIANGNRRVARLLADMPLEELRVAREMTQAHLATLLGKDQSQISKMEKRTDMYVSTLREFIRALGGDLEIRAVFPNGSVRVNQFETIEEQIMKAGG